MKTLFFVCGRSAVICVLSCALLVSIAEAEVASREEMQQVCQNWLSLTTFQQGDWAGSSNPSIASTSEFRQGDTLLARCYHISPKGFIVVPLLKELPPIKAYSVSTEIDPNDDGGIAKLLHDVLLHRTRMYVKLYGSMDASQPDTGMTLLGVKHVQQWSQFARSHEEFAAEFLDKGSSRESVGPLLTTAWHQLAPYNNYCPMGDGSRCVVWCVATALAQIIWYHEWPPAGIGHTSYFWDGDQSCGGSTPGRLLTANFSDRYDYDGTIYQVAELSCEVGKAYHVDYGVCYSVGDTMPTYSLLPDYFAYKDSVRDNSRSDFTPEEWFAAIQDEINNDRPIDYLIFNHMIVCDGWMTVGQQKYYHMNYGWGDGHDTWYALDNLYCAWPGCDPTLEHMYTHIEPDRQIIFYADTIAGHLPLNVHFTASSDRTVDSWTWDFGDDDSAFTQMPSHTYQTAGIYDVSLAISYSDSGRTMTRTGYIYVIADSMSADDQTATPGEIVEITLSSKNLMPLTRIEIPIEYTGDLALTYDSFSTIGCRTENFQNVTVTDFDPTNKRLTILMEPWVSGYSIYPFLEAGEGSLLKLYFTVSPTAEPGQETVVKLDGYQSHQPRCYGSIYGFEHIYQPITVAGLVHVDFLCGDTDGDGMVNIADVVYLIDYVFGGGPPPDPLLAGDVDCNALVNIADVVYLINFIFGDGPEPCAGCP